MLYGDVGFSPQKIEFGRGLRKAKGGVSLTKTHERKGLTTIKEG